MTKRMWAAANGVLEIEGRKGFFDVAYGNVSSHQKLDVWLPDEEKDLWRWINEIVRWLMRLRSR